MCTKQQKSILKLPPFWIRNSRAGNSNSKAHCAKSNEEVKHILNEEWFLRKIFVTEKKSTMHHQTHEYFESFFFVKSKMKKKICGGLVYFWNRRNSGVGAKKINFLFKSFGIKVEILCFRHMAKKARSQSSLINSFSF